MQVRRYLSPMGLWMDYWCRFGSLGNSFTASGIIDLYPDIQLGSRDLFVVSAALFSILTVFVLPFSLFLCLISFLLFSCASVWENSRAFFLTVQLYNYKSGVRW